MRRGDLFVLSWESLRRVEWGKVSSFLSILIQHTCPARCYRQPDCAHCCVTDRVLRLPPLVRKHVKWELYMLRQSADTKVGTL